MKFKYDTRFTGNGFEMVPRIPVQFRNPKNGMELPIFCLVDSGATEILINTEIAKALGIQVEKGKKKLYGGIGGVMDGYQHKITMRLAGDTHEFEVSCGVLDLPMYDGLLGQNGFFDNYKVVFEKYKKRFEVTAHKP